MKFWLLAVALGLLGQIRELKARIDPEHRHTDIACQFVVQDADGNIANRSPVYGGRYDSWAGRIVAPATAVNILPCTDKQLELILSDSPRVEASGGRGSGKTEGGVLRVIRHICERPNENGEIVSPIYKLTTMCWKALLPKIPHRWLLPGLQGVRRGDRELFFRNGVWVRFMSADNPDSLRSWGGGWAFIDEEQDVSTEATEIIWPSLRKSSMPRMWSCGTPKRGDYLERHLKLVSSDRAHCFTFSSYSNTFTPHEAFNESKSWMNERVYRQEIEADWAVVMEEDQALVLSAFARDVHGIAWPPKRGLDITREVTKKRSGYARDWIAGVDYNWDWPNYAVLLKVIAHADIDYDAPISDVARKRIVNAALKDHRMQHWCAVRILQRKGHAGHMGQYIKAEGFDPGKVLVIDDASGQYNRGKHSKNSSSRLMRDEGFTVVHPSRNPSIKDAVNAVLAKLMPVEGDPSLHLALPDCEELAECCENLKWKGEVFDKTEGFDHAIDALKYPIAYFCPAARIRSSLQGYHVG